MAITIDDVLTDLVAEYDRLEVILGSLTPAQWLAPSGAPGWTVRDVIVHLAQTEAGVVSTIANPVDEGAEWTTRDRPLDRVLDDQVFAERAPAHEVFAWWCRVRRESVDALRAADPGVRVRWAAAPLTPRTLATTRLAEHWAHALDVTEPFGIELPDTDRLRHLAWLGHATLPYAFRLEGKEPCEVRATLTAPSGALWSFGPDDAENRITGSGGAFCRVGARRVAAADSGLVTEGPRAAEALRLLRNYAA